MRREKPSRWQVFFGGGIGKTTTTVGNTHKLLVDMFKDHMHTMNAQIRTIHCSVHVMYYNICIILLCMSCTGLQFCPVWALAAINLLELELCPFPKQIVKLGNIYHAM